MKLYKSCVPLVLLLLHLWTIDGALYPGASDPRPSGAGAPSGLSSGWKPPLPTQTMGSFRRPPPIQGFPALTSTDLSAMTNNFNSRFVPGYAGKPNTSTASPWADHPQTLTSFAHLLEGLTTENASASSPLIQPIDTSSSSQSSISSYSPTSSSQSSTASQPINPFISKAPNHPHSHPFAAPPPPKTFLLPSAARYRTAKYSQNTNHYDYTSWANRSPSPHPVQLANYYTPVAPPPTKASANIVAYPSSLSNGGSNPSLHHQHSHIGHYQRPQNTHHPSAQSKQNQHSGTLPQSQYASIFESSGHPQFARQRRQQQQRYFSSSSYWPSYNYPQQQQQPQQQQRQQQHQQQQQQQQYWPWSRQDGYYDSNSATPSQQSSYYGNNNNHYSQYQSNRQSQSYYNPQSYNNNYNHGYTSSTYNNYNNYPTPSSPPSPYPQPHSHHWQPSWPTPHPGGPSKAPPSSYYQILQNLRMQFKKIFPNGLPSGLDRLLNGNVSPSGRRNAHPPSPAKPFPQQRPTAPAKPPSPAQPTPHHVPWSPSSRKPAPRPTPLAPHPQPPFSSYRRPPPPHRRPSPSPQSRPPPGQRQPLPTQRQPLPTQRQPLPTQRQSLPTQRQPLPTPFMGPSQPPTPQSQPPPRPHGQPTPRYLPAPRSYHAYNYRPLSGSNECSGGYVPGQLCCDGIRNMIPPGGEGQFSCCHKTIYNMTSQLCCADRPVPRPAKALHMMCCGTMLYDPDTHICCDQFPYPNRGGRLQCCRKRPYNPSREMCCGESVKPRSAQNRGMDCCGKHMYNPATHICCEEGNTFMKGRGADVQCCGKNQYRPDYEQCCFGDALPMGAACIAK